MIGTGFKNRFRFGFELSAKSRHSSYNSRDLSFSRYKY